MRCRGLLRLANPAYLEGFPFPALLSVAPYCVPGGIRVVSAVRGLCLAGSSALDKRVGMGMPYPQPVEFTLDHPRRWAVVSRCRARPPLPLSSPRLAAPQRPAAPHYRLPPYLPPRRSARTSPLVSGLPASCPRSRRRPCGRAGCPWGGRGGSPPPPAESLCRVGTRSPPLARRRTRPRGGGREA